MSNIDSRTKAPTHDRFKTTMILIRLLLNITPILGFSAAC